MSKPRGKKQVPEVVPAHQDHEDLRLWRRTIKNDPCSYCGRSNIEAKLLAEADGTIFYIDDPRLIPMTEDHIVPRASGGLTRWNNLAPACRRCNEAKSHHSLLAFMWAQKRDDQPPEEGGTLPA